MHPAVVSAGQDEDLPRLRTDDPDLAAILESGRQGSPTLNRLADGVQQSDLIVHLERHNRFRPGESGSFQLIGTRGGQRYVRIAISSKLSVRESIVVLAHELQHANEVAAAPHVIDERGLKEFYCTVGELRAFGYDTIAARQVARQVTAELAANPES